MLGFMLAACGGSSSVPQKSEGSFDKYWPAYVATKLPWKAVSSLPSDRPDVEMLYVTYWMADEAAKLGPPDYPGPDDQNAPWRYRGSASGMSLSNAEVAKMRLPNPKDFPFIEQVKAFTWARGSDAEHAAALDWYAMRQESLASFKRYNDKNEAFRKAFEEGLAAQFTAYRTRLESEGDPKVEFNSVIRFCELLKTVESGILGAKPGR